MRIGIFTDTYPPYINGVSTSIAMLEAALKKKGHQVFIVTVNPDELSYNFDDNHVIRIPGIPTGIYDYRLSGVYPLKAINKIKEWNLDIIHSHTEFGVGAFARIMARQLDIPLVHTYHTMYEDYVYYITKGYFDAPSKKIVEYLTKFVCDKTVTELIVPTKKTYDLFKQKYGVERPVHIIPTGIEVNRFFRENNNQEETKELKKKCGISDKDFVIMFVGRLAAEKDVSFLIENHVGLVKKYPNCKLLIIGDGPDAEGFKKQAEKLKISDKVIFTGKIPWEDIHKYYQIPDVFTTASHTETQGLTLIEAMAASVPVVALDDESFRDVVIPDLNGYLFNNKKEYKEYMCKLIEDNKLLDKFGTQARINAEGHSSKYYAEKVLDVYYKALGGRKLKEKRNRSFLDKMKDVVKRGFHGK